MRRCPQRRNHWEMTTRCKSKNRDRTRPRRVLLCKTIVTEEGLHRCMNFRVAPVHNALVSASKVCRKDYRIILGFRAWTKWHAAQTHERMDRVARRKRCLRFRRLGFSGNDSWRKRSKVVSLTPYEHNVDVALVDFPRQENHP